MNKNQSPPSPSPPLSLSFSLPLPLSPSLPHRLWRTALVVGVLLAAAYLGRRPSMRWLMLFAAGAGGLLLLRAPILGLYGILGAALMARIVIATGTEVELNVATLLIPAVFLLWLVDRAGRRELHWANSRVDRPLLLFLLAGLIALLAGNVLWDPAVPKSGNFWLVQLAQWGIFAFAALAFWLVANMAQDAARLEHLTWTFLFLGGGLAILRVAPGIGPVVQRMATIAVDRAPFWVLLTALAGGQLLFNDNLTRGRRLFLFLVAGAIFIYAFIVLRENVSNWVGVAAVAGTLVWMRFVKLRGAIITVVVLLILTGILFPSLYEFAGGDDEWTESGGSRLALIERVIQVTMRNPITGLGPASYRPYTSMEPLRYGNALWIVPKVNSHNNYVDIFAHTGLLGFGLFLWFMSEIGWLGWQRSTQHRSGFAGGYANGMFAAWAGSMVIMMFADWMLPFVYNIGFPGFQASLLVWLFFGGLVCVRGGEGEGESGGVGEGVRG
ncbi:MAG TPA: O-antigen ligase family protein [Anaerolineae bacterium]|nr:O-antigen ligase family protein [Anaerolineae bacterium]